MNFCGEQYTKELVADFVEVDLEDVVFLGIDLPEEVRGLFLSGQREQAPLSGDDDVHLHGRSAIAVHAAVRQ